MRIFVVIPAFNEEETIGKVVEKVRSYYENVIVVNDGSSDRTAAIAEQAGAKVYNHILNRGQGAALKTGMKAALLDNADIIVHFDADGQHSAEEIGRLIEPVAGGEADIAIGSRFMGGSDVPFARELLLKGAVLFTRLTTGLKLTDAHNGFRAVSRQAAERMVLRQDKMAHASEILGEIARLGLSYKEVPVTITYSEYSLGKGQNWKGAFRIVWDLLKEKITK